MSREQDTLQLILSYGKLETSQKEVAYLMTLLQDFLNDTSGRLERSNIRIRFIGSRDRINRKMVESMERIERISAEKTGLTFIIALDYGARQEITQAVKRISSDVKAGILDISQIDEQLVSDYLYTKDIPDPDLIIRRAGEAIINFFCIRHHTQAWYRIFYGRIYYRAFKTGHNGLQQQKGSFGGKNR